MAAPHPPRSSKKLAQRATKARGGKVAIRRRSGSGVARRHVTGPRGTEYRRVFPIGHSLAVTLPPACVRLLGVGQGGTVQVVPLPSGKVVIAPMRVRVALAREMASAVREVAMLRRQVSRLQRKVYARPLRVLNQGMSLGWMKASTARFHDLDRLLDGLRLLLAGIETGSAPAPAPAVALPPGRPEN